MVVTVKWLITQTTIPDIICLAGESGLNHSIRGINFIDNPDTVAWLRKDEFILSTGYFFTDSEKSLEQIRQMAAQGCAGLGLKLNRYISKLPQSVVDAADALSFPVICLPFDLNMEQISNLIYRQLFSDDMAEIHAISGLYRNITEIVIKKHHLNNLLKLISQTMNVPGFFINESFEILEYFFSDSSRISFPLSYMSDDNTLFPKEDIIKLTNMYGGQPKPVLRYTISADFEHSYPFVLFPVTSDENLLGYLAFLEEQPFTDFHYTFIYTIQPLLSISMANQMYVTKENQPVRNEFFHKLLSGKSTDFGELEMLCASYHIDYKSNRICFMLSASEYEEMSMPRRRAFERKLYRIFSGLDSMSDNKFEFVVYYTDLLFFVFLKKALLTDEMNSLCRAVCKEFIRTLADENISASISYSLCHNGVKTYYIGYTQARAALTLGRRLHPEEFIFSFFDDYACHIFSFYINPSDLSNIYQSILQPLKIYDEDNQTNLMETLEIYIRNNYSCSQSAKDLFIHRNTMFYRLQQISSVLGIDLKKSDNLFLVHAALYIGKLLDS